MILSYSCAQFSKLRHDESNVTAADLNGKVLIWLEMVQYLMPSYPSDNLQRLFSIRA